MSRNLGHLGNPILTYPRIKSQLHSNLLIRSDGVGAGLAPLDCTGLASLSLPVPRALPMLPLLHGRRRVQRPLLRAGFNFSVEFHRNFGVFFVFASYREEKFRYFSVFFVFKFKNSKIFIKNSKKYDKKLGVLLSKYD